MSPEFSTVSCPIRELPRALEIGNAAGAVKNTVPGDLPSSDLREIETLIREHKHIGPQLEMAR